LCGNHPARPEAFRDGAIRPTHNKQPIEPVSPARKPALYTAGYDGASDAAVQHVPCAKIVSNKNRQKKFLLKLIFV
jgi:hypothetical protein